MNNPGWQVLVFQGVVALLRMGLFFGWSEGSGTLRFLLSRGVGLAGLHAYAFDLGELRALGAVLGFGGLLDPRKENGEPRSTLNTRKMKILRILRKSFIW